MVMKRKRRKRAHEGTMSVSVALVGRCRVGRCGGEGVYDVFCGLKNNMEL